MTTGQIAARLRKLVIEADPDEARRAYEQGTSKAKVWSCLEADGTGTMISTGMEARDLSAANRNINHLARQRKNSGEITDTERGEVYVGTTSRRPETKAVRPLQDLHPPDMSHGGHSL